MLVMIVITLLLSSISLTAITINDIVENKDKAEHKAKLYRETIYGLVNEFNTKLPNTDIK